MTTLYVRHVRTGVLHVANGNGVGVRCGAESREGWVQAPPGWRPGLDMVQCKTCAGRRGRTSLDAERVAVIKALLPTGEPRSRLARYGGVKASAIQSIDQGRAWAWVEPVPLDEALRLYRAGGAGL